MVIFEIVFHWNDFKIIILLKHVKKILLWFRIEGQEDEKQGHPSGL